MEIEEGIVIENQGQTAIIRINKSGLCAHCKAGCMEQGGYIITEGKNSIGAKAGDTVLLSFDSRIALNATLIVFGLPLLAILLGAFISHYIAIGIGYKDHNKLISIGGGAFLFILSFIPIKIYDKHFKESGKCNANLIAISNNSPN